MSQSNDSGLNIPTWQERAKASGDWPLLSGDAVAPYLKAEVDDLRAEFARRAALANQPAPTVPAFPERDQSKPAEQQGLFHKFDVQRTDGSDQSGGKHHGCRYYVLDLDHDQHAPAAMRAYAAAARSTHPQLAADIEAEFGSAHQPAQEQAEPKRLANEQFLTAARIALVSMAHAAEKHGIYQTDYERFSAAVEKFAQQEPVAAPLQTTVRPAGYLTPGQFKRLALGQVAEILPVESGGRGKTAVYFAAQLDGGQEGSESNG